MRRPSQPACLPPHSRNQISALPACLCRLPLKVLIASNNKLASLPEDIGSLGSLRQLVSLLGGQGDLRERPRPSQDRTGFWGSQAGSCPNPCGCSTMQNPLVAVQMWR